MAKEIWRPDEFSADLCNIEDYKRWLATNCKLHFSTYQELWEWSVTETKDFWKSLADYFDIIFHDTYSEVHDDAPMPFTKWFDGATLNYAEHIFRSKDKDRPAIIHSSEREEIHGLSWDLLEQQTAALAHGMRAMGISKGDRVVAYLPNIPEATIAFLATCSIGAIWSSSSPDFGSESVKDRFAQIEPKLLFTIDGYQYNGKAYDKLATVKEIQDKLPTLAQTILIPYLDDESTLDHSVTWMEATSTPAELTFEAVPFDHPLWVLFSSGTTGIPKAITHSHGGNLLEHYKYLSFHNDVQVGERFFWYTTTGWMMWNYVHAALLVGGTIVLYDGSPAYPNLEVMWRFAKQAGIHHFGTSAPFIVANMKQGMKPKDHYDFPYLRSISSTGAPLPPDGFDWIYKNIKEDLWLVSMSGGTDVCTAFVGGVPTEPVYQGEIQARALGVSLYAFDEAGKALNNEVGEMVITKPMPSMPIYFWNDPEKKRYQSSYFDTYPNIWRHGDWVKITDRNSLIILGRSDATLNRDGIRIGTAEIYRSMNKIDALKDSLIINIEKSNGTHYMPLFVQLNEGFDLDPTLIKVIKSELRQNYSPRHVPDEIIQVEDIPYTISGKKLESPIKKLLMGMDATKVINLGALRNPDSVNFFIDFKERMEKD